MHFRITIPTNVKPGQTVRIRCPDGTEGDVLVPKNLKAGDDFIFEMSGVDEERVREVSARQSDDADKPSGDGVGSVGGGAGGGGGASSRKKGGGGGEATRNSLDASSKRSSDGLMLAAGAGASSSFLDREIINRRDFVTALAIGMMIGLSIVGGFLVGVLLVTDPSD